MKRLGHALTAALAAGYAFGGAWDANVADFPRLAGEKGDSARIMRAVGKAGTDGVVWFPRGEYDIDAMLCVTNRCSLLLHSAAHLVARAKMKYVVFWDGAADYHALSVYNPDGSIYDNANLFIKGGDIDGNGLASCLAIANAHHFTLSDVTLHNGVVSGLCVTRETGGHLYELVANNVLQVHDERPCRECWHRLSGFRLPLYGLYCGGLHDGHTLRRGREPLYALPRLGRHGAAEGPWVRGVV